MLDRRSPRLGPTQLDILDTIQSGITDPPSIGEDIGRCKQDVWDSLARLIRRGLVVQIRPPRHGKVRGRSPGTYSLTDYGRREYARALALGYLPGVVVGR